MARPKTITDEAIIEVARELFIERGPSVPTAEIARAAGISEGLIFKRFPTKHELFLAAMGIDQPPVWTEKTLEMAGQGDVKENLELLCRRLLEFVRELLPRIMLMWSSGIRAHEMDQEEDPPPKRVLDAFTRYIEEEMQIGRLREGDPQLAARIFVGSTWNLVFMETVGNVETTEEPGGFARRLVDTLWSGLKP
jgi:AcrR family transcriptional regulator